MNHLTKVKMIQKLNDEEIRRGVNVNASWHTKYSESAYIYVGGFPYEMTEGDMIIAFSQYGEIVDCRIVRDKESGKSKGFAFLCYEDQRSTDLAVDNLNGTNLCGRIIRVDHVEQFKIPKEYFEQDTEANSTVQNLYEPTGPDGKGWDDDRIRTNEEVKLLEDMTMRPQEIEKSDSLDVDENWERQFLSLVNSKKEEEEKLKKEKAERRQKKKAKKAKKEAKRAKRDHKKKLKEEAEAKRVAIGNKI